MIKKKAKSKAAKKKPATTKKSQKVKPETNPAEVRKEVSKLVAAGATKIAQAVIGEAEKGQLAPAKYLFEMASIFPPATNGEQATTEEDCLAKLLLSRIEPAKKADGEEEQQEAAGAAAPATEPAKEDGGSEASDPEREGADSTKEVVVTEGVQASGSEQAGIASS